MEAASYTRYFLTYLKQLSDGVSTYTYNHANQLTGVSQGGTNYSYAYNGLGDRLRQTVGGNTVNYVIDSSSGLSQVLADGANTYLYGLDRISQSNTGGKDYFLGDALESVRQLANTSGGIILSRNYEPYGTIYGVMGNSNTAYGFTSEWTDGTGLVNLRARYYSPMQGRFVSRDTWGGDYNNPVTLARWLYANGNPVLYTDPTGLKSTLSRTGNAVAAFILDKINKDSQSEEIISIKKLNSTEYFDKACDDYNELLRITKYGNNAINQYLINAALSDSLNKAIATAWFGCLVADGRTRPFCGQWDYKVDVSEKWGNFQTVDFSDIGIQEEVIFYYDIWANIHFGFLGSVGGFSVEQLTNGAAVENGLSNGSFIFQDDPSDLSAIWIGIAFYQNKIPLSYSTFLWWLYAMQQTLNKGRIVNGTYEIYR